MLRAFLAAALFSASLSGCGWLALTHDTMLGPASPAGRIHPAVVGSRFRVTATGPVADSRNEPLYRPYPPDMLQRLGRPSGFYSAIQGLQAFIVGFTPLLRRGSEEGRVPDPGRLDSLPEGASIRQVLAELGPPEIWIRRERGSLLLYRESIAETFALYLGVPPLVGALIPFPGVGNLRFRYISGDRQVNKLMLVFDAGDRLVSFSTSEGQWQRED
jgi:hypothetical protein